MEYFSNKFPELWKEYFGTLHGSIRTRRVIYYFHCKCAVYVSDVKSK